MLKVLTNPLTGEFDFVVRHFDGIDIDVPFFDMMISQDDLGYTSSQRVAKSDR